jgi:hypothetical protein
LKLGEKNRNVRNEKFNKSSNKHSTQHKQQTKSSKKKNIGVEDKIGKILHSENNKEKLKNYDHNLQELWDTIKRPT